MKNILKSLLLFTILIGAQNFYSQLNLEDFVGKKYKKLLKVANKDSSFVNCRLLTANPNKVTGVELFFKNNIHYAVNFTKSKLDDSYDCESGAIKRMEIYVIHYYKDDVYQNGFCNCSDSEKARMITPVIKKVELEQN